MLRILPSLSSQRLILNSGNWYLLAPNNHISKHFRWPTLQVAFLLWESCKQIFDTSTDLQNVSNPRVYLNTLIKHALPLASSVIAQMDASDLNSHWQRADNGVQLCLHVPQLETATFSTHPCYRRWHLKTSPLSRSLLPLVRCSFWYLYLQFYASDMNILDTTFCK